MRPPPPFLAAPIAALALGACQPSNDAGMAAKEPADAPVPPASTPSPPPLALTGDFDARGTEPFWGLSIRADQITLTRPDHAELVAANPGPKAVDAATVWETTVGAPMRISLRPAPCSDGMSDLSYPLTAELRLGAETLKGCAARAGEMPREGG